MDKLDARAAGAPVPFHGEGSTLSLANGALRELAPAYKKIADDWEALAGEIERAANIAVQPN